MASDKQQDRWWAHFALHLHDFYMLGGFVVLALGAVGVGWQAAFDAVDRGENPFVRVEFIACLPLVAFAALVLAILFARLRSRKRVAATVFPSVREEDEFASEFDAEGATILFPQLFARDLQQSVVEAERLQALDAKSRAGIRNPLGQSEVLARIELQLRPLAESLLGQKAAPVRSILFDKTPETNWDVAWHQDVTIAVKERRDVDGFGPWSVKQGVPHVQPPASVLEKLITLRLHLDDCPAENGPLLVVPGSHTRGVIDVRTLDTAECDRNAVACVVNAGDVVAMRPLILHASKKSLAPSHRRVLHIEYACEPLPGGLKWA